MIRNADYLLREVADTWVIVPVGQAAVEFSGMITLNSTGAYIWELLEKEQTLQTLAEALMAYYEVDQERAYQDAKSFVDKLIPIGAILEQ